MSELTKEVSLTQQIIKELMELRQYKAEKDMAVRANLYYLEQVSQMEVSISELKALILAKDDEINRLRGILKNGDMNLSMSESYEHKSAALEHQNERLKSSEALKEIEKLRNKLEIANKTKEMSEAQNRENLVSFKNIPSQENEDYIIELQEENQNLQQENDKLRCEIIPGLKAQLKDAENQRSQIESQIQAVLDENDDLRNKLKEFESRISEPYNLTRSNLTSSTLASEKSKKTVEKPEAYNIRSEFLTPNHNEMYLQEEIESPSSKLENNFCLTSHKSESQFSRVTSSSVRSSTPSNRSFSSNADFVPSFMRKKTAKKRNFEIQL